MAQRGRGPHARAPRHARDERHERPLPRAADPDARAVGDVVGDVHGHGAHRVQTLPVGGPIAQGRDQQRQRRHGAGPPEGQPEHQRGRPGPRQRRERRQRRTRRATTGDVRRHADGVSHQPAQAPGQDGDGSRQRRQCEHGPAGQHEAPHRQRPAGQVDGSQGFAVAPGQRRGRRPVEGPAGQEGSQRRRALVGHRARRHVAHVPAGLAQAPHQVHVLATAQRRIEEVGAQRHVGPDQQGRARVRRGCGSRAAPARRGRRGRATIAPPRSGRGRPARTMRGATAATNGSSKWPNNGPSHPSAGTQSESTNATSAVWTTASPALRAPAGPTLVASPTKRAPCRSVTSLVAPASADASSTTTQARPPGHRAPGRVGPAGRAPAPRPSRPRTRGRRPPPAGRTRPPRPIAAPVAAPAGGSRPRRRPPALHQLPRPLRDPEEAERAAAEQHGPPVELLRRRVLGQGERAGQRRRGPGRARAAARRASRVRWAGPPLNLGSPGPGIGWAGAQGGRDAG